MSRLGGARTGLVVAVGGAVGVVVGSFLPYARSGSASRTSYEVVRAAERLDVVTGATATLARGWFLVPLLGAVAWLAAALGRRVLAVASCVILSIAALILALLLKSSPLRADVGLYTASLAGVVSLAGVAFVFLEWRREQ